MSKTIFFLKKRITQRGAIFKIFIMSMENLVDS